MWKIAVIMMMAGLAATPAGARQVPLVKQGPTANLKAFSTSLDLLGGDSTLADSGKIKIQVLVKAYKGLVQKLTDSIDLARKAHKTDTVVVVKMVDSPARHGGEVLRRDIGVKQVVVMPVDSVRALIARVREGSGIGANVLLFIALLLVGVGGVGWGLFVAGRERKVGVAGPEMVKEVTARPEVKEVVIPVEEVKEPEKAVTKGEKAVTKGAFVCELMMTAGPRKKFMNEENADKDLGEDVCGCVVRGDTAAVWLLDGTSDQFCLRQPETGKEYFSSRLLAQDIGDRLRGSFQAPGKDGYVLDRMMAQAVDAVREEWGKALRALPEGERVVLAENIRGNNCPECSSTMLAGVLSLDGMASVYRSGDSKLLLYQGEVLSAASLATKNPESNDRIFFRIVLDTAGELDILSNKPAFEVIHREGVRALVAFSDGVGSVTEEALKTGYGANPVEIRRRIGNDPQGTADDKSICFVRITEE
jgi:hypothetical protein